MNVRVFFLLLSLAVAPTAFASIWYVDGANGSDTNDCKTRQTACKTIGHAISLASAGDAIGIGPAIYTENLTVTSLKLIGSGASTTIIDGGAANTVVTTYGNAFLSKLTIRNGSAKSGGGIANHGLLTINNSTISGNKSVGGTFFSPCGGGGIYNEAGTLTINDSTISGNQANWGGGICNRSTLTINGSTISGNKAFSFDNSNIDSEGGGIFNLGTSGTLTLTNSTLSANSATNTGNLNCGEMSAYGGGIYSGNVTINNSTLSGNYSRNCEGVGNGGGIYSLHGNIILQNTIVADSPTGGNCDGPVSSKGYNLSSDGTCNFNGPGDLNHTAPLLGPLQNNGGPTQTQALPAGSPATDAGNPRGCTDSNENLLKTDQRGAPRPDKEDAGGCDMGAFERQRD